MLPRLSAVGMYESRRLEGNQRHRGGGRSFKRGKDAGAWVVGWLGGGRWEGVEVETGTVENRR